MLDLEELPLYQEDWLGLASLHNQQKLHKVKSNHESVNILDKLRQLQFDVSNTFFTFVHLFVCDLLKNSVLSCTSVGTTWTLTGLGLKKTLFCHSLSDIYIFC